MGGARRLSSVIDSVYAGDVDSKRSTTGYVFLIRGDGELVE